MNGSMIRFHYVDPEKNMSYGCRCLDRTPLTDDEIEFLKGEIHAIEADEASFVFNDEKHIKESTCYDIAHDVIYVTRNVFPDTKSYSLHPRDQMSPRAVLAHEYYGHKMARERYLKESNGEIEVMPIWKDEAYASANAALYTPNLDGRDRVMLLNDAALRAQEAFQQFEFTDEMREIIYGSWNPSEKGIVPIERIVVFRSMASKAGDAGNRECGSPMPRMQ